VVDSIADMCADHFWL